MGRQAQVSSSAAPPHLELQAEGGSAACRNLLCNLVRVKLSCYQMEKQCSLSVEDYLKAFLETEVKPLWPKGWMQARWVVGSELLPALWLAAGRWFLGGGGKQLRGWRIAVA